MRLETPRLVLRRWREEVVRTGRGRALVGAVLVHLMRLGVIVAGLAVAPLFGVRGWWAGVFVNGLCCVLAVTLMTRYGLWRSCGMLTGRRDRAALLALTPLVVEALVRVVPSGLAGQAPGLPWWALTLLLVGFNEELVSRGVVLTRLLAAFPPVAAVTLTAVLFGLQHLSSFLITSRGAADVLANVASSAAYGFGLAAFQWRYAWLWPLVLVHATADFTIILSVARYPDWVDAGISVALVGYGAALLWRGRRSRKPRS